MTAPTSRRSVATSRTAGVVGSFVLHAGVFAAAAVAATGLAARRDVAADDARPLAVAWTRTPAALDDCVVVARMPSFDVATAPPPRPIPPTISDVADASDVPGVACAAPGASRTAEVATEPEPRRAFDARVPARRRGGASGGADPSCGAGASSIGVGGPGGLGMSASVGFGGTGRGVGCGDGVGDEPGAAPARGGATRGPSIVGALAAPTYPSTARARGWEGRVVLLLSIDERGRVVAVDVADSSGRAALDDAARDAARDWTFAPALREDVAVAGTLRVPVRFALSD